MEWTELLSRSEMGLVCMLQPDGDDVRNKSECFDILSSLLLSVGAVILVISVFNTSVLLMKTCSQINVSCTISLLEEPFVAPWP